MPDVVTVNGAGDGERREGEEALPVVLVAAEAYGAEAGQLDFMLHLAVQRVHVGVVGYVLVVREQQLSADYLYAGEHRLAFGYYLRPVLQRRFCHRCGHYPAFWRAVVGEDVCLAVDGLDGVILVSHVRSHGRKRRVGLGKVFHVEGVAGPVAALVDEEQRLVVAHAGRVEAFGVSLVLVDEPVSALRSAELVVVYLVVLVHVGVFLACLGRVVCAVIEAVAAPCCACKLGPHDVVVERLSAFRVDDVYFRPVRTAARDGVGHVLSVVREACSRQGHGAVGRQLVGVEHHACLTVEAVLHVEHALVLQSVVLVEVILAVLLRRSAYFLVVGHGSEPP